ncbi:unnamed protein product, partial [Trichogramma brassicae]
MQRHQLQQQALVPQQQQLRTFSCLSNNCLSNNCSSSYCKCSNCKLLNCGNFCSRKSTITVVITAVVTAVVIVEDIADNPLLPKMSSCFSEEDEGSGLPPFQKITALGFLRCRGAVRTVEETWEVPQTRIEPRGLACVTNGLKCTRRDTSTHEQAARGSAHTHRCPSIVCVESTIGLACTRRNAYARTGTQEAARIYTYTSAGHAWRPTSAASNIQMQRHQLQQQALVPQQQQLRTFSCLSNNCLSNNCSSSYCKCSNCKLLNCGNFCSRKSTITVVITAVVTAVVIVEDIADNPLLPKMSSCFSEEDEGSGLPPFQKITALGFLRCRGAVRTVEETWEVPQTRIEPRGLACVTNGLKCTRRDTSTHEQAARGSAHTHRCPSIVCVESTIGLACTRRNAYARTGTQEAARIYTYTSAGHAWRPTSAASNIQMQRHQLQQQALVPQQQQLRTFSCLSNNCLSNNCSSSYCKCSNCKLLNCGNFCSRKSTITVVITAVVTAVVIVEDIADNPLLPKMSSCFSEEDEGSGLPPFQKITALGFLRCRGAVRTVEETWEVPQTRIEPRGLACVTNGLKCTRRDTSTHEQAARGSAHTHRCPSIVCVESTIGLACTRRNAYARTGTQEAARIYTYTSAGHAWRPTSAASNIQMQRHQLQQQALVPQQQQLRTFSCLSNNCLSNNCSSSYCKCSNCKLLNCGNFCSRKSTITVVITAVVTAVVIVEDIADNPLLPKMSSCFSEEDEGSGLPPFQKITALGFLRCRGAVRTVEETWEVPQTRIEPRGLACVTNGLKCTRRDTSTHEQAARGSAHTHRCPSIVCVESTIGLACTRRNAYARTGTQEAARIYTYTSAGHAWRPTSAASNIQMQRHQLQQQALVPQQQQLRTFSCLSNNCLSNNCSSSYCKCSNCKLLNCGNFCSRKSTITVVITAVVTAVVIVEDIADNPLLPKMSSCFSEEDEGSGLPPFQKITALGFLRSAALNIFIKTDSGFVESTTVTSKCENPRIVENVTLDGPMVFRSRTNKESFSGPGKRKGFPMVNPYMG